MKEIGPPDRFFVSAAAGWLELGLFEEGLKELDLVRAGLQSDPRVGDLRWQLNCRLGRWEECLRVAHGLKKLHPERVDSWVHSAYAARRAPGGGLEEAKKILLAALDKFPKETIIPYNLACYECQLGLKEESLCWLAVALERGRKKDERKRLLEMALSDTDLEPIRKEVIELAQTYQV
jgi:tetratricopeptide (TPR) repeat protein